MITDQFIDFLPSKIRGMFNFESGIVLQISGCVNMNSAFGEKSIIGSTSA
jgi:hypothetical protein